MKFNCSNCLYVLAQSDINRIGEPHLTCRRFPPTVQIIPTNQGMLSSQAQPVVKDDMICGEYRQASENPREDRTPLTSAATALYLNDRPALEIQ